MKKKILSILLALMMVSLLLVACGNNEPVAEPEEIVQEEVEETENEVEEVEEEEEPEEEPEEAIDRESPTRGVWENGVYTSEYLGLRFAPPGDWSAATDEEIAATMGIGMEVLDAFTEVDVDEDLWDELDIETFHEMIASNVFSGANVQIIFENLGFAGMLMSESSFIQMMQDELSLMGIESSHTPGTTSIGAYDWYSLLSEMEIDIPGVGASTIYTTQFINLHRGFIRIIAITTTETSESVEDVLGFFIGLDEDIPEHEGMGEMEVLTELVGTWAWDEDSSYTYVFNADGTGTRGFASLNEDFQWGTMEGDHLIIDMGLIGLESWTFTIQEGVLTIESRQVPGMVFSYTRQ